MTMSKKVKNEKVAEVANTEAEPVATATITLKANPKPFRPHSAKRINARLSWYERLQKFDGKTVADFVADVTANPPSLPVAGKHAGEAETPAGWLGYMTRTGRVTIA